LLKTQLIQTALLFEYALALQQVTLTALPFLTIAGAMLLLFLPPVAVTPVVVVPIAVSIPISVSIPIAVAIAVPVAVAVGLLTTPRLLLLLLLSL
jgi:hypothetical protein